MVLTMARMAARWDWLKPVFCGKLDSSGLGSDSTISSIEDNEAWSDRALSSWTLSRFAVRLDDRPFAVVVLVAGRTLRALALVTRFSCAVVDVTTFPGKASYKIFKMARPRQTFSRSNRASSRGEDDITRIIYWGLTLLNKTTQVNSEQLF